MRGEEGVGGEGGGKQVYIQAKVLQSLSLFVVLCELQGTEETISMGLFLPSSCFGRLLH